MRIPGALADSGEELVDLPERQRVVQRLQRVDGGHHGASFEACGRGDTWHPRAHQLKPRHRRTKVTSITKRLPPKTPRHGAAGTCLAVCDLQPSRSVCFHTGKLQKNHAERPENGTQLTGLHMFAKASRNRPNQKNINIHRLYESLFLRQHAPQAG